MPVKPRLEKSCRDAAAPRSMTASVGFSFGPPSAIYSFRLVHEDLGALLAPVGYEEAGSSAPGYWVACKPVIVIGILLLQDINETLSADDVDAASAGVVEKVVRVTDDFGRRDCLATLRIKDEQAGRHAAPRKQAVMTFVERHRQARGGRSSGPTGQDRALRDISDLDLLLIRNIHENASAVFLKLK